MSAKKELAIINSIPKKKIPVKKKIEPVIKEKEIIIQKELDFEPIIFTEKIEYKINYVSILQKLRVLKIIKLKIIKILNTNLWSKYWSYFKKDDTHFLPIRELDAFTEDDLYEDTPIKGNGMTLQMTIDSKPEIFESDK